MHQFQRKPGINPEDISESSVKYTEGKREPIGEGVLIWDETKVRTCILLLIVHSIYCIRST